LTITTDLMLLARQDLAYEAAEHKAVAAEMYHIAHLSRDGDLGRTGFPLLDQETGVRYKERPDGSVAGEFEEDE